MFLACFNNEKTSILRRNRHILLAQKSLCGQQPKRRLHPESRAASERNIKKRIKGPNLKVDTSFTKPFLASHDSFLTWLLRAGMVTESEILGATRHAQEKNLSIIEALLKQSTLDAKFIAEKLAEYLELPFFDLNQPSFEIAQNLIDTNFIRQHQILPLFIQTQTLYVAITDPSHLAHIHEIKFHTDLKVHPVVVAWDKLNMQIENYLNHAQYQQFSDFSLDHASTESDVLIINWVAHLLKDAIKKNVSDIHIEPYRTAYRIRFRLDGLLHKVTQLPLTLGSRITARLKIMARLDVAERRLPQDGRFTFDITPKNLKDCRISVCPTLFGEKTVVRILDAGNQSLNIDDLGLDETQKSIFLSSIQKPQGMILVTGPTGSGKTLTLYSALNCLNSLEKNICTAEDPVEITLPGIQQVHVDSKIDLSFSKILRTFLRQDPDILMIGEIRDQETAETAIKAAQTGHLVFSTLHTNSAIEALTRLFMLGISPFNIAHSVQLIIAQRLVRKLCIHCKGEKKSNSIGIHCDHCINGYSGRIAVFEFLPLLPEIASMIIQANPIDDIANYVKKIGMINLYESGLNKAKSGITSLEEVQRVLI